MLDEVREQVDRAMEHLGRGSLAEAAAAFEEAVKLDPGDVALRQRLAGIYLRMGHRTHARRGSRPDRTQGTVLRVAPHGRPTETNARCE